MSISPNTARVISHLEQAYENKYPVTIDTGAAVYTGMISDLGGLWVDLRIQDRSYEVFRFHCSRIVGYTISGEVFDPDYGTFEPKYGLEGMPKRPRRKKDDDDNVR